MIRQIRHLLDGLSNNINPVITLHTGFIRQLDSPLYVTPPPIFTLLQGV